MSTFRQDLVTGFTAMMQAFIVAHPANLKKHFRVRPPSQVNDLPYSYLDIRNETAEHDSGLRTRTFTPSIVVVFELADNGETLDLMDATVDLLMDHFTSYTRVAANSWWSSISAADEEADPGRFATRFTWNGLSLAEGRT